MSSRGSAASPPTKERGVEVDLPPVYVLRQRHVAAALGKVYAGGGGASGGATMWIHSATVGIEKGCFALNWNAMDRVSKILVRQEPDHGDALSLAPPVAAAALGALIRKLGAYEQDLVDLIYGYVTRDLHEMHRVGDSAFRACRELREVALPRHITHINDWAFYGCTKLAAVSLPDSVQHIGYGAFCSCVHLMEVKLPSSLSNDLYLGDGAFEDCTELVAS